jgi:predicted amidohydrolase
MKNSDSTKLNIGVAQITNSTDIEKNFNSISNFLSHFEKEEVDVVLFPECSLSGFSSKIKECTEEVLKPYLDKIQAWCSLTGINVVLPTALSKNGKIYNSGYWFNRNEVTQFYKTGLTKSEENFFSIPEDKGLKILSINNFNLAVLICFEAEHAPSTYFEKNEADIILWPGYWGWTQEDNWNENERKENKHKIFSNMIEWKIPLIQSNFSMNDLGDHRASGPQGLSHVINEENIMIYRGAHLKDEAFIVNLIKVNDKMIVTSCNTLITCNHVLTN